MLTRASTANNSARPGAAAQRLTQVQRGAALVVCQMHVGSQVNQPLHDLQKKKERKASGGGRKAGRQIKEQQSRPAGTLGGYDQTTYFTVACCMVLLQELCLWLAHSP